MVSKMREQVLRNSTGFHSSGSTEFSQIRKMLLPEYSRVPKDYEHEVFHRFFEFSAMKTFFLEAYFGVYFFSIM